MTAEGDVTGSRTDPFSDDVVSAITAHMDRDHRADSLLICRTLGGEPRAAAARVRGVDAEGVDFAAVVDGREVAVRLPWSRRLQERSQVRAELVRMVDAAHGIEGGTGAAGAGPRH